MTVTRITPTPAEAVVKFSAQAIRLLEAGFASEARRKEALGWTSRAYETARRALCDLILANFPADADGVRKAPFEELYWGIPMELHQWRPGKHGALFGAFPAFVEQAANLLELRDAIKAAVVDPRPPRTDHPLLAEARISAEAEAALQTRHARTYQDTLDMGRRLGGLPVSVNRVFCANHGGTVWVRLDWYLRGERTAFSIIAAAYDQLVREGAIKEDAQ
ncbi:MAG TPA: hypothetical protein VGG68_00800 [Caulobacteraceae bacterium]|jgi:hypothetical protein